MAVLAQIWRHPIKGIGAEPLDTASLTPDRPVPGDRAWALAHTAAEQGPDAAWLACRNFLRGASAPGLMAITATTEADGRIRLCHPDRPDLIVAPGRDAARLIAWIAPLWPEGRPAPARVVAAPDTGMTDVPFPSVSVLSLASLRVLSGRAGRALDPRRFRGNLWLDDLAPWEEFDWIGKSLRIGSAEMVIRERITRCRATEANPETGLRDTATLALLDEGWGHQDFGVYAQVTKPGTIAPGASVEVV